MTQARLLERFREILASGRLAHGYLLYGPPGIGKREFARKLAKLLLCPNGGCDHCPSCLRVDAETHADFRIVRRAPGDKELKIEHIRELQEIIARKPMEGPNKVFILADCQYLNEEASNALLKVVEEPPPRSFLILVVETPEVLPETIRSRCQEVRIPPRPSVEIEQTLATRLSLNTDEARFLARLAGGSLGRAEEMYKAQISEKAQWLLSGLNGLNARNELVFGGEFYDRVKSAGKDLEEQRNEVRRYLEVLNILWRDMLHVSLGLQQDRLLLVTDMARQIHSRFPMNPTQAAAAIELCLKVEQGLQRNANLRLLIENFVVDIRQMLERV